MLLLLGQQLPQAIAQQPGTATGASVQRRLATHDYVQFDVSSAFDDEMPESFPAIKQAVRDHCPVKLMFVVTGDKARRDEWWGRHWNAIGTHQCAMKEMTERIGPINCNISADQRRIFDLGIWAVNDLKPDTGRSAMTLYVLYNERDTPSFNQLLTGNKFTTHAILFDVNKSTIKPESAGFIASLAEWMKSNPGTRFEIAGHTDGAGDSAANMKLSQARAEAVKKSLIAKGVSGQRLQSKGYGATRPIGTNTTAAGMEENRRVEFVKL